ncbi:MAG: hypothetical protein AMXMBFR47_43950 [Planctomycetota bacterium]
MAWAGWAVSDYPCLRRGGLPRESHGQVEYNLPMPPQIGSGSRHQAAGTPLPPMKRRSRPLKSVISGQILEPRPRFSLGI